MTRRVDEGPAAPLPLPPFALAGAGGAPSALPGLAPRTARSAAGWVGASPAPTPAGAATASSGRSHITSRVFLLLGAEGGGGAWARSLTRGEDIVVAETRAHQK